MKIKQKKKTHTRNQIVMQTMEGQRIIEVDSETFSLAFYSFQKTKPTKRKYQIEKRTNSRVNVSFI